MREWGDPDAPATVLWPGLGYTGLYFAELAERLPRAVAIDPPGHGRSPQLTWEDYALPNLAELAHRVLRQTGGDAFVGHSWGGSVGAALVAADPESLRALVLVDGGFIGADRADLGLPTGDRESLLALARERVSTHDTWEPALAEVRTAFAGAWSPHLEALARDVFVEDNGRIREHTSPEGAAAAFDGLGGADPHAAATRIRETGLRTLLLVSGRSPNADAKRRAWERFADAAGPTLELRVDEQAGHHLLLEASDTYVPLVAEWLSSARLR